MDDPPAALRTTTWLPAPSSSTCKEAGSEQASQEGGDQPASQLRHGSSSSLEEGHAGRHDFAPPPLAFFLLLPPSLLSPTFPSGLCATEVLTVPLTSLFHTSNPLAVDTAYTALSWLPT